MNTPLLTQLPITYIDSFSFENIDSGFQIRLSNLEQQLVILLKNVLTFSFSKEDLNSHEDWIDIVELTHAYRKPTEHDLRNYLFSIENLNELSPLHIVTLYGNTIMEIVCEEIAVEKPV